MSNENTFSSIDYREEILRSVREKLPHLITGLAVIAVAGMAVILFYVRVGTQYTEQLIRKLKPAMSVKPPQKHTVASLKTKKQENGQISAIQSGKVTIKGDKYVIKPGDTLATIAERAYGDENLWTRIAEANNLTIDSVIHADNTLIIPR